MGFLPNISNTLWHTAGRAAVWLVPLTIVAGSAICLSGDGPRPMSATLKQAPRAAAPPQDTAGESNRSQPDDPAARPAPEPERDRLERVIAAAAGDSQRVILGQVLVEAEDGGLLLLEADGRLTSVEKEALVSREATDEPFVPWTTAEVARRLQEELGPGFDIVTTRHYVIASAAGRPYGQWCGGLFERLYAAFHAYWKARGVKLTEPEFPLLAIVLANETRFAAYASRDAGPDAATAKGYYSIPTNRMVLYDLTASPSGAAGTPAEINRRLAAAPYNVATIVHEATHQIAFNTGLQTRLADNPLWLSEGMAMYFETPDLSSKTGWKTVGALNDLRLRQFRDYLDRRRPADSLATLIATDARFTAADTAGDAYAEAWSLSYFLMKTRSDQYAAYVRAIGAKPRLQWDDRAARLADFKAAFGDDLAALEVDWLRFIRRLKA